MTLDCLGKLVAARSTSGGPAPSPHPCRRRPPPSRRATPGWGSAAALNVEALGFCGTGEVLDFIADGRIRPGGDLPLDTSGGGLSYSHPGQLGILLLVEAVRQLRGEAEARQVEGATTAVAHGTGGILSTHATVVLGVGRMILGVVPEPDDVTAGWWAETRERRLVVQACDSCNHRQHPPRAVCTQCGSMDHLTYVPSGGIGEVDSWTEVHRAPLLVVPYTIARVRLAEGPILLTRLVGDGHVGIGDQVEVGWIDLADGRALPVFSRTTS